MEKQELLKDKISAKI